MRVTVAEVVVSSPTTPSSVVAVGSGDGSVGLDAVQAANDSTATNDQAAILLTIELRIARFERKPP